jgi:trehalose/maltose hydrolase-like predicted phosphorylase
MIGQDVFGVEPWEIPEHELHLDLLGQTESIFALSNGHIGRAATSTRESRRRCRGPT